MERTSVKEVMMRCALAFAERSTCQRIKAGAIIVVDNHIVSTGYNGNAPGKEHCSDHFYSLWKKKFKRSNHIYGRNNNYEDFILTDEFKKLHHEWAITHELHAEMNSIIYSAKRGISIEGGDIYTTYSPCIFCTKAILQAGLKRVFYNVKYDRKEGLDSIKILEENGIKVEQIDLSKE